MESNVHMHLFHEKSLKAPITFFYRRAIFGEVFENPKSYLPKFQHLGQ